MKEVELEIVEFNRKALERISLKHYKKIAKKVKALCDILEIDHLGLICEGVKRLMKEYNEIVVFKVNE